MSTLLLKDVYNVHFYSRFLKYLKAVYPSLNNEQFLEEIFVQDWATLELKQRMKLSADVLHRTLPYSFKKNTELLKELVHQMLLSNEKNDSLALMFLADYMERYGIDDLPASIEFMEKLTELASCEFAVRQYIIKYPQPMIQQMTAWSTHPNHHVRRLASEGMRPRLPWAVALPEFKKNPAAILPILENLKTDSSEYVRKSVANNLNDISKDNPLIVFDLIKNWKGHSKATDWIIKHGCRTLLKQGHPDIFKFYDLKSSDHLLLQNFKLENHNVKEGSEIQFSFTIQNNDSITHELRLEYAMYYKRQSATLSKKVFKISEKILQPNESLSVVKKQSFKPITTRKYYLGTHQIGIIINGIEKGVLEFELI